MQHGDFFFNGNVIYCETSIEVQTLSIQHGHYKLEWSLKCLIIWIKVWLSHFGLAHNILMVVASLGWKRQGNVMGHNDVHPRPIGRVPWCLVVLSLFVGDLYFHILGNNRRLHIVVTLLDNIRLLSPSTKTQLASHRHTKEVYIHGNI